MTTDLKKKFLTEFLKDLQGKKLVLITKNDFHYIAHDLKFLNSSQIFFLDKFNNRILLDISQVKSVEEATFKKDETTNN